MTLNKAESLVTTELFNFTCIIAGAIINLIFKPTAGI